jgi:23S rRNA (uracil1939-C5)-methyltransferase
VLSCPHRPPCPGCPRLGETDIAPQARAALDAFGSTAGVTLTVVHGAQTGFRHRARLAVRGRSASPKIGIFQLGSHRVVDIPRCVIHHPLINEVATELRHAIRATGTSVYSDEAHQGLVRYLQVVADRGSETAQVVVVTNSETPDPALPLLDDLAARLGDRLHSLFWNGNAVRSNAILGSAWHRLSGPEALEGRSGEARVFYPPGAFGQSHADLSASLVSAVHALVPSGARVTELYAGVGAIGLGLATRASALNANELAAESLRGLALGVEALDEPSRSRVHVVTGTAGAAAHLVTAADVVIVDPPRKGLDRELLDALVRSPPSRLVYVACGLDTFLSDARALLGAGARLTHLAAYDMFPHTEHVETLACFDR